MKAPRKRVYLVRHGVTAGNEEHRIVGHEDLPLSERGRAQAVGAGRLLVGCSLDLAITSPLARTRQTAELVLEGREALALEVEPRLIELKLKGWEGRSRVELEGDPLWQTWLTAPDTIATPEGERLVDVQRRAVPALRDALGRTPPGGGLVVLSHGGVLRVLILTLLGMPLGAYQKLRCDCASVSAFEVESSGELARALALNLTEPLLALDAG